MKEDNQYKLINIILTESSFKRVPLINFNNPKFSVNSDVELKSVMNDKNLNIF